MYYQPYLKAEALEHYLGDPHSEKTTFSYENSAALDIEEAFPQEIVNELQTWGLHHYYVPVEYGGNLESYEQLLMLLRLVARRDLTVAIGHGKTYLGSVSVWVGGDQPQKMTLGQEIRNGTIVSLALTERAHGSDLLANDFDAEPNPEGFLLTGEKWLINNATRGDMLTVFARTDVKGGARGYSVFLVDKNQLGEDAYTCLNKVKTHGIKGADISGIQIHKTLIAPDTLVGKLGHGLDIVLKSLQITRTLCASLSLGAADNALRLTYQFAITRELYDQKLRDIPHTRRVLLQSFSDLLIAEVCSITSSRGIHVLTEQMSLISAVAKYFIPTSIEDMISQLGKVLGARAFLVDLFEHGRYQKLQRDHRIVALFDGNTLVNLQAIINQLKTLAKFRNKARSNQDQRLATLFDVTAQLPDFQSDKLSLTTKGQDTVLNSLYHVDQLDESSSNLVAIKQYVKTILAEIEKLDSEVLNTDWVINSIPARCFTLAQRYCLLYAAAACIQLWLFNQQHLDSKPLTGIWHDGIWLRICLERLLNKLKLPITPCANAETLFLEQLDKQYHNNMLFSLFPLKLSDYTNN
ncbi:MAG: acyl-CoA dehydrogenase [Xenococcaceae cyanobacterium MO_167.B27]|nr:acyl-CoA dehydrogenase [Xenococcaceae cyanobacterium MO_167.B27]